MMSQSCDERDCLATWTSAKSFFKYCFVIVSFLFCFLFFSESHIKLIINTGNLDREKKKFMEETLTQIVHAYVKFNVHSRDNHVEYLKSLNHNIFDAYAVLSVTVHHHSGLP